MAINNLLSANSLQKTDVRNTEGKDIGHIEEIMINPDDGTVAYAVLSFGGFLGVGDKLFAVPWQAFTIDTSKEEFILDVSKEFLHDAPGFDKDNWPMTPDDEWYDTVYTYYGLGRPTLSY